jgi:hypothetical protein
MSEWSNLPGRHAPADGAPGSTPESWPSSARIAAIVAKEAWVELIGGLNSHQPILDVSCFYFKTKTYKSNWIFFSHPCQETAI